jgi:hypothetical protein
LLPIMMWLYISFSPSEHYALGAASSRKAESGLRAGQYDEPTIGRSAKSLPPIAEHRELARLLSGLLSGPCFTADELRCRTTASTAPV